MPKKWKSKKMIPLDVIQTGLKDPDWCVRTAAMQIAKDRGIDIPPYRAIEPPELVYKKCEAGVIVVAHIPADAECSTGYHFFCTKEEAEAY